MKLAEYASVQTGKMPFQEKQRLLLILQNTLLQAGVSRGDEKSDEVFRSENAAAASDIRDVARNGNDKIQKAVKKQAKRRSDKNAGAEKVQSTQTND